MTAPACVCHTTTDLDSDGRCRRHPVSDAWPAVAAHEMPPEVTPDDGLFPAPAPAPKGITPADLDVPDPAWRKAVDDRRGPNR